MATPPGVVDGLPPSNAIPSSLRPASRIARNDYAPDLRQPSRFACLRAPWRSLASAARDQEPDDSVAIARNRDGPPQALRGFRTSRADAPMLAHRSSREG